MKTSDPENGFTLIELLISLTILSLILVLVFSAFQVGISAWEKGGQNVESLQEIRAVASLFRQQAASLCTRDLIKKNPVFPEGTEKSLEFASDLSLIPGQNSGTVISLYRVEEKDGEERLLYSESRIGENEFPEEEEPDDSSFHELLSGMHRISFSYLKKGKGETEPEWQDSWSKGVDTGFPAAMRMSLTKNPDLPTIVVIASILSEVDKDK